jgi:hypothetical protein
VDEYGRATSPDEMSYWDGATWRPRLPGAPLPPPAGVQPDVDIAPYRGHCLPDQLTCSFHVVVNRAAVEVMSTGR